MSNRNTAPVIAIDGPSGVGKTTIASLLAQSLGYHILASGFIYRVVALISLRQNINIEKQAERAEVLKKCMDLSMRFELLKKGDVDVYVDESKWTNELRSDECAGRAAKMASFPELRTALMSYQHNFIRLPGLVAEGRDMGTIVFPEAVLKIFLNASLEERGRRYHKQLKNSCNGDILGNLEKQLERRDALDKGRTVAPLVKAQDAVEVDTTSMSVEETVEHLMQLVKGLIKT